MKIFFFLPLHQTLDTRTKDDNSKDIVRQKSAYIMVINYRNYDIYQEFLRFRTHRN